MAIEEKSFLDPKRILIIKLGAMGDVIMSEGIMRCIRLHYPRAHITLMTEPLYTRFLHNCPHVNAFLPYHRAPRWRLDLMLDIKDKLLKGNFDLVIDLQNSPRTRQFQSWLKNDASISSMSRHADRRYHADRKRRLPIRDYLREQVNLIGVDTSRGYIPDLRWAGVDTTDLLAQNNIEEDFILLIPGSAARHPQKRWQGYGELATELSRRGFTCVTAPGPDELDLCAALPTTLLLDRGRPLSFNQLIGLADHCHLIIGNDTGPTHLMSASGTRGIALFASNNSPAWSTGIAQSYEVIEKPCMEDISPSDVMAAVDRLYSNSV
jgi:ADP-heptose:LPS heptosyltransferase